MTELGDDVQDVFAGVKTVIYLQKGEKLDEEVLAKVLAKHKFKPSAVKRDDEQIL